MKDLVKAHGNSLGCGVIRSEIEDFEVTEIYDFEPTGEGEHLLLWIEKRGANTGWVANRLAEFFELRHFDVSYCGKKDRHAVTRQWFSCWLPGGDNKDLNTCEIEGVTILKSVRHSRKLRRGDHLGNHFRLRIRNLNLTEGALIESRLEEIRANGFPNYFGRQRFGHDQQNLTKACELANDPEMQSRRKLDRKQKDIYVSALRSWLFNARLAEAVTEDDWQSDESLWVHGLSPHRDITIPPVPLEQKPFADFIENIGIKAHERSKRVQPRQMSWQIEPSEIVFEFSLPIGAYATTLLEEVLEIEDAQR